MEPCGCVLVPAVARRASQLRRGAADAALGLLAGLMMGRATQLRGSRILVLNWRDIRHPQAGGAEQYMHEIASRWGGAGAAVTWVTARAPGQPARGRVRGLPPPR